MPLGDGTGPRGQGPRTGRGAGSCPPVKGSRKRKPKRPLRGRGNRFMGYGNIEVQ